MAYADALKDYQRFDFTDGRWTRPVYRRGSGPAVIVIHEMPGLHPAVVRFADRVAGAGMTVFCPVLFGVAGRPATHPASALTMLGGMCVRREFHAWSAGKSSPIVDWLRALARKAHAECGGRGVGAVGMCFTGNFALAMMVDDRMLAPVLSQPSLPFPLSASRKRDLALSEPDLARVKERAAEGQCVIGLRFTGDRAVPEERFLRLREELGDKFIAVEIDSSKGNPYGNPTAAHSVLTEHLVDEPGHPTREALDQVLAFYRERLLAPSSA